jgi:hypothetical protein
MSVARTAAALAMLVASIAFPRVASAQAQAAALPGRIEASVGLFWIGHQALGDTDANETTGTGGPLRIFTASSDLASAAAIDGRVGVRVLRSLEAALEASYDKPKVNVALGNDIENASPVVATETIQQLMIGGSVVWYPSRGTGTSRLAPFATGGGGYLRQVHESGTLVDSGHYYQFGGGVKYLFSSNPARRLKGIGVRAEARAVFRANGVAFDDKLHAAPALGIGVFVRF